jgi:predicted outer membrane repeat protein
MSVSKNFLVVGSTLGLVGGASGALIAGLLAGPASATGTTFAVDTLADGAGVGSDCSTPVPGSCSLRDALDVAGEGDTIAFAAGLTGTINIDATQGQFEIDFGLTIAGPGAASITIDAGANSRIFYVCTSGDAPTISGITMTNGLADKGGAVYEESCGGVILRDVVITGNEATYGGGVYSIDDLWIYDSTISNNVADGDGGGIYAESALIIADSVISGNVHTEPADGGGGIRAGGTSVSILRTEIAENVTQANGGGLYSSADDAVISIVDSTIAGNEANYGGGISVLGARNSVLIANSTITGNQAMFGSAMFTPYSDLRVVQSTISANLSYIGAVVIGPFDTVSFEGAIVSGNTAITRVSDIYVLGDFTPPVAVTFTNSLVGEISPEITAPGAGNIISTDPGLGPLADNGGLTRTMALLPGSAAIDAGSDPVPTFPLNTNDQRGAGYARVSGGRVDIGAFEIQIPPAPEPVVPIFTG